VVRNELEMCLPVGTRVKLAHLTSEAGRVAR
jgi:hypothetical protein